ncbi:TetR/AcrR family transcriptional regulator [Arcanobacterium canis]|uniref:TetR/AcrR family transcriptional regulator n=1 Tax=Arcanobacterium canis TaxID=999183 RepID=A0ABY8G017_9ACTO|nr:TetR/AcrR family transcriptional regulator [Arcanobacterium canis]WFM84115.1 TetR/AcrR family transcriptional regulator [Arcanobacterium canis]
METIELENFSTTPEKDHADPRYLRSRELLRAAAFELALTKRPDDISIAELTKRAGVSRGTFYAHASTPPEFIAHMLLSEIAPILEPIGSVITDHGSDYLRYVRNAYGDLLRSVVKRNDIYRNIFLTSPESTAVAHIAQYLRQIATRYVDSFAHYNAQPLTPLWRFMAIEQQVSNFLVLIRSQLRTNQDVFSESTVNTFMSLVPPWQLARFNSDGRFDMRHVRAGRRDDKHIDGLEH